MPGIKISKENFTSQKKLTPGIYPVRMDGFEQKHAKFDGKEDESINLNPILIIVNNPDYHNYRIREWLNTNGHQAIVDFFHCFGLSAPENDEIQDWANTDDPKVENWRYTGQLLNRTGRLELAEKTGSDGKTYLNVKRYFCAFPQCNVKHSDSLFR